MTNRRQIIGSWGEDIAVDYLQKLGYKIIDRNYSTAAGEIDIIAQIEDDGETFLIFIEVKTRTSLEYGNPEDAVTERKKDHLLKAIYLFFEDNEVLESALADRCNRYPETIPRNRTNH